MEATEERGFWKIDGRRGWQTGVGEETKTVKGDERRKRQNETNCGKNGGRKELARCPSVLHLEPIPL